MMNPLKVALWTLCAASILAVVPCALKKFAHSGSPSSIEKNTGTQGQVAELPVASAPSLLSAKKSDFPSAPAKPVNFQPAQQVANLPAPSMLTGGTSQHAASAVVASMPAPTPALTPIATPKPEIPYRPEVARAQELMAKLSINTGKIDGKLGQKTEAAITEFQKSNSLRATGDADKATIEKLEALVAALPAPAPKVDADSDEAKPEIKIAKPAKDDAEKKAEIASAEQPQFVILRDTPLKKIEAGKVPTLNKVTEVKRIQEALVAANLYGETPDGKWGKKTIAAVEEFQKKNKLDTTGKPDSATWKKLVEVANKQIAAAEKNRKMIAQKAKTSPAKSNSTESGITVVDAVPARKGQAKSGDAAEKKSAAPAAIEVAAKSAAATDGRLIDIAKSAKPATAPAEANVSIPEKAKAEEKVIASAAPAPKAPAETPVKLEVSQPAKEEGAPTPAVLDLRTDLKAVADAGPAKSDELVIRVNADAGASKSGSIATPAVVSKELKEVASAKSAAPDPFGPSAAVAADEKKADEAPAVLVSAEPAQASTKVVEPVSDLLGKVERDLQSSSAAPEASKAELKKALGDLEAAKKTSVSKKAKEKVDEVDAAYKLVKTRFSDELKKEPFADTMDKIENGYQAMKADFKKGNYDPIVERADGFKLAIELLANDAAKVYVEKKLESKSVREKISKTNLKEIEELQNQRKYLEASSLLDTSSKNKTKSGS